MATLALKVLASAQSRRDMAAYLDLSYTFDPDYAARCGVNLDKLVLVRPHTGGAALEILHSLVASRGVGVLVFDPVSQLMAEAHGREEAIQYVYRRYGLHASHFSGTQLSARATGVSPPTGHHTRQQFEFRRNCDMIVSGISKRKGRIRHAREAPSCTTINTDC